MRKNILVVVSILFFFTGCYDDQAILNDPTIHPVENAEDKLPKGYHKRPYRGYNRYYNGYYYYDDYYYYNGYYHYTGDRSTRAARRSDDEIIGNGPLSYQHSREGIEGREADGID